MKCMITLIMMEKYIVPAINRNLLILTVTLIVSGSSVT